MPPAEKEAWVARSEADKARYLKELAQYEPPPGYDAKGDAIVTVQTAKGRRGKPEKDPNAPKKNMSAYLLYQNAMRDIFKRENPGMSFGYVLLSRLSFVASQMNSTIFPFVQATFKVHVTHVQGNATF